MIVSDNDTKIFEVSPKQAREMLDSDPNSVLLDVRSKVEFDYVGHPIGAVNVPWQEPPGWKETPEFAGLVRKRLTDLFPEKRRK